MIHKLFYIVILLGVCLCLLSCGKTTEPVPSFLGDINLDGYSYTVADAVMLVNYFLVGEKAFGNHVDSSVTASDINLNGIPHEVADVQYLVRIIIGDVAPLVSIVHSTKECVVNSQVSGSMVTVKYECPEEIGAVWLRFRIDDQMSIPIVQYDMDFKYEVAGDTLLNVLVYNFGHEVLPSGDGSIISFNTNGTAELIDAEVSNYSGVAIPVTF
ncbi:MAG: hypothetical protein KAR42_10420 [candidate division Zixibacteria bacterium]|nr:hypothetical protein [candidate division Zixibacteria bacterium]